MTEVTKNETVNIHVIHSMKGGCGKSTCALSKALELANQVDDGSSSRARVLFVDVDFRGSALQWLLFEREAEERSELLKKYDVSVNKGNGLRHYFAKPDNYNPSKNLSKYLQGDISSVSDIIYHTFTYQKATEEDKQQEAVLQEVEGDWQETEQKNIYVNGYLDFVLSSSENVGKNAFRHNCVSNKYHMPTLTAGIFLYRISAFLNKILMRGKVKNEKVGQYSEIVIDMPPSYDEYSDILLMELKRIAHKNKDIKLHYYAVTTDDAGHMHLTYNNLKDEKQASGDYEGFTTLNVILNSVMPLDFQDWETKKEVNDLWVAVHDKGKMYKNTHESSYHKFCQDIECQEFSLVNFIREVKRVDEKFQL